MALTKIVNGQPVQMSAEEEAAMQAEWTANANAPAPVPKSVTPLQMRKALRQVGLLAEVKAMVEAASEETREEFEYAVVYERVHPAWDAFGALLDPPKTPADIDNIFRLAATK